MSVASPRTVGVLINPRAGQGEALSVRQALEAHCRDDSRCVLRFVVEPSLPDALRALARLAPDQVVVCGGDGTVVAALAACRGADIPVGIVPTGTGNLLALNLGLPAARPAQFEIALHGEARPLDLIALRTDRHPNLISAVVSGVGYDALLIRDTNPRWKRRFGALAYVLAALRRWRYRVRRVQVALDGQPPFERAISSALVANVGRLQGGVLLFPDATPDSGQLSLALVSASSRAEFARIAWSVLRGRAQEAGQVERHSVAHVRLDFARPIPFQQDGESRGRIRWLEATVLPGAALVRRPPLP